MLGKLCLRGSCKQWAHISCQDGLPSSRTLWRYRSNSFLLWLFTGLPASFSIWHEVRYRRAPLKTNWTKSSGHFSLILPPSTQLRPQSGMSENKLINALFKLMKNANIFVDSLMLRVLSSKNSNVSRINPYSLTWWHWCKSVSETHNLHNIF